MNQAAGPALLPSQDGQHLAGSGCAQTLDTDGLSAGSRPAPPPLPVPLHVSHVGVPVLGRAHGPWPWISMQLFSLNCQCTLVLRVEYLPHGTAEPGPCRPWRAPQPCSPFLAQRGAWRQLPSCHCPLASLGGPQAPTLLPSLQCMVVIVPSPVSCLF